MASAKHAIRQRDQRAVREEPQDFAEQPFRQLLVVPDQLIDVHAEVGEVLAQWPKAEMRVGVEIAFAQLDEATEATEAIHGPDHGLARQRVEHHIHSRTAGKCGYLVDK